MTTVRELHNQAMDFANLAMVARQEDDADRAKSLVRQAYELEAQAANQVPLGQASEPTRSILYRGAASLAIQCDELNEARRLIALGLSEFPPKKIENDLLNLLEDVKLKMASDQPGKRVTDWGLTF